jgi:hypothetical protein
LFLTYTMTTVQRLIVSGIAVLALTGCAAAGGTPTAQSATPSAFPSIFAPIPSASASAAEEARIMSEAMIMLDYDRTIRDIVDILGAAVKAAEVENEDTLTLLGVDFVKIGKDGLALADIPENVPANNAWDTAMRSLMLSGGYLQMGKIDDGIEILEGVGDNLRLTRALMGQDI